MLTQNEREWLEYREIIHACEESYIWAGYWEEGVEFETMREAAEFEARVAAKLAINDTTYLPCHQKGHENQCPYDNYCPTDKKKTAWCKLKHARLQVEEEMDEQSQN